MRRLNRTLSTALTCLVLVGWTPTFTASEPPDSQVNLTTGNIESVSSSLVDSQHDVFHVIDPGQGAPTIQTAIADTSLDESGPRLSILAAGSVLAVWWLDGADDEVWFRGRDPGDKTWNNSTRLSEEGTGSRNPELVQDGTYYWIVFEQDEPGGGTGIVVWGIRDDFEPVLGYYVGETWYGGDKDTLIHYASDSLWVTWVDSTFDVGWSVYDPVEDVWSATQYEPYSGEEDIPGARDRVRDDVLGGGS